MRDPMIVNDNVKNNNPDGSSDRSFGLVFSVFFLIVAFVPWVQGYGLRVWAIVASLLFGVAALGFPGILAPFNRLWTKFGMLLHNIVSPVVLAVLFYLVVTPTGVLMRLLGKDVLRLRFDGDATSYWIDRTPPGPDAESLKNQF
jgi:hypothetical protein